MKKKYILILLLFKGFIFILLPILLVGAIISSIIVLLKPSDFSIAFKIEKSASFFGIPHKLNEYIKGEQNGVYTPLSDSLTYFNNNEILSLIKFNGEFLNNINIETNKTEIRIYNDRLDTSSILNSSDGGIIVNTDNGCIVRKDYNNTEFKKYYQKYYTKDIYEFNEERGLKVKSLYFVFEGESKNGLCYRKVGNEYISLRVGIKLSELDEKKFIIEDITGKEVEFRLVKEINQDILKGIVVPLNNSTFVSNFIEDLGCNPNRSCKSIYNPTKSESINDLLNGNIDNIILNDYRSIFIRFRKNINGPLNTESLFKNDNFFIRKITDNNCEIILEKKNEFENKTKNNYEQFIINLDGINKSGGECIPKGGSNNIINIKYFIKKINTFNINNTERETKKDINKRNLICGINNYENIDGLKSLTDTQIKLLKEEIGLTENEIESGKVVCSNLYDDFIRTFGFKDKEEVTKDEINMLDRSAIATYLTTSNKLTDFYGGKSKEIIFNDLNIQQLYKIASEYMLYYINYDYDGYGDRFFLHPNSILFSISKSDNTTVDNFFTKKDFKSTNFIKYYIGFVGRELLDKVVSNIEEKDDFEKNKMLLGVLLNYLSIISEGTKSDYYLFNTFRDNGEYSQLSEFYYQKNSNKNIDFEITQDNKDFFKLLLSKTIWTQKNYNGVTENILDLITFNSDKQISINTDKTEVINLFIQKLDNPDIIKRHPNEIIKIIELSKHQDFIRNNINQKKGFEGYTSSEIKEIERILGDISYGLSFDSFKNNYNPDDLYNASEYVELKKNISYNYIQSRIIYEKDTGLLNDYVQDGLIFIVRKGIENFPVYNNDLGDFSSWMRKVFNYSHTIGEYEAIEDLELKYKGEYITRDILRIKLPFTQTEINLKKGEYVGGFIGNSIFPPLITINLIKNQWLKSISGKDAWLDVYYNMSMFLLGLESVNKEFLNYENIDLNRTVYDVRKMQGLGVFSKFYFNDRYYGIKVINQEYTEKQIYTESKELSFGGYKKNQINKQIEGNKSLYCNNITDSYKKSTCYSYMDYLKGLTLTQYNQEMEWLESYFIFRDAKNNNGGYWGRNIGSPRKSNSAIIGECTHYVMIMKNLPGLWGNGGQYIDTARKKGYTVIDPGDLSFVKKGYLVSFGGGIYGHIALVEEVDLENNRFKISEQNWKGPFMISERWVDGNHKSINGFIIAEDKY